MKKAFPIALMVLGLVFVGAGLYTANRGFDAKDQVRSELIAQALHEGFTAARVPWSRVHPDPPHTHQFQVWLPYDADVLNEAALTQAEETGTQLFWRWFPEGPPGLSVTEVTVTGPGLAWTPDDVRAAVAEFVRRLP